ncbi:MAG: hypothetical protein ACRD2U_13325 [Terriglobales bacterium]
MEELKARIAKLEKELYRLTKPNTNRKQSKNDRKWAQLKRNAGREGTA